MNKYTLLLALLTAPLTLAQVVPYVLLNYAGIRLLYYVGNNQCADCLAAASTFSKRALSARSSTKTALYLYTATYLIGGRPLDAVTSLKAHNTWPPSDLSLRVLLANALARNKSWNLIDDLMGAGWKSNSWLAVEMDALGKTFETRRDFANARSAYWAGFTACFDQAPGIISLLHLAKLAYRQGELEDAILFYRKLAMASPLSASIRCELARILLEHGNADEAFDIAITAISLDPKYPGGYAVRGSFYLLKGDAKNAILDLESAERLAGSLSPWSQLALSQAYAKIGHRDRACGKLKMILKLNPDFQPAVDLLKSICFVP